MALEISELTKRYRNVTAVDGISFTVDDASTFAFLGTNGAGKSSTIGCLTTVLDFDSGQATVAGYDVRTEGTRVRQNIGVVFQDSLLDPTLTVTENLRFRARLNRLGPDRTSHRIDELAAILDFGGYLNQPYGTLSGGQRRRVDIARALLHEPAILFLDEPTSGLDPASRSTVWGAIHELRRTSGLTVFLTTHYMEETEQADQVCIIEEGSVIAEGTPAELRATYSQSMLTVDSSDPHALIALAKRVNAGIEMQGESVQLRVDSSATARALLDEHGNHVVDFEFRHGRMDDVFLALTGHDAVPGQGEGAAA